ncbi:uncharacterized protein LOC131852462 [Achroia grisella]|uniref:uncharacterized protein LOC131852462 n=1 Tax=Achroia grisella TaxID=688607 RepID=UPI0027D30CFF|nr:uncharacterized protein LOC131852462 [Achroia grisella]
MSRQRTPSKFTNPGISTSPLSVTDENNIKSTRRQPDDETSKKGNEKFCAWNNKIDEGIIEVLSAAVKSSMSDELPKISATLSDINTSLLRVKTNNNNLEDSVSNFTARLSDIVNSLNTMYQRQDSLEQRLNAVEVNNKSLNQSSDLIKALETKINYMEQQGRDCNIEMSNVPENRNENLMLIATTLGTVINQKIEQSDIVFIHRVPHASRDDTRPMNIIVKFASKFLRDSVLVACRRKRINTELLSVTGPVQYIYVNEHLTVNNKLLFRECRQKAKDHNYKYVWVKKGVVLVRKTDHSRVLAVRTMHDIANII